MTHWISIKRGSSKLWPNLFLKTFVWLWENQLHFTLKKISSHSINKPSSVTMSKNALSQWLDWLNFDFCMLKKKKCNTFFNANDSLAPRPFCKVSTNFCLHKKWLWRVRWFGFSSSSEPASRRQTARSLCAKILYHFHVVLCAVSSSGIFFNHL